MINDDDSLKLIIEEQRRDYDYLLKIYERAGAKENVLLAASFAAIAYLYSGGAKGEGIANLLFIPAQDYGLVIYVIATAFFFFGLFKLMLNVFGDNVWETAYETAKTSYTADSTGNLQYVKERYDICHKTNLKSYLKRKSDLRLCFFTILVSAIVLLVIKTL